MLTTKQILFKYFEKETSQKITIKILIYLINYYYKKARRLFNKKCYILLTFVGHKLGKLVNELHDDLILPYLDDAPSLMVVWRWVDLLKCGVEKLKDQH